MCRLIGIRNRIEEKTENRKKQQQRRQRSPVIEPADAPVRAPSAPASIPCTDNPDTAARTAQPAEDQPLPDMSQNVMPHLVPDHRNNFRRRLLFDRRVPHHDALRSAQARSRRHSSSASCRSPSSRTSGPAECSGPRARPLSRARYQRRILLLQRRKGEKHRLQHKRFDKRKNTIIGTEISQK